MDRRSPLAASDSLACRPKAGQISIVLGMHNGKIKIQTLNIQDIQGWNTAQNYPRHPGDTQSAQKWCGDTPNNDSHHALTECDVDPDCKERLISGYPH
mgnify:CR=1 FL=1